MRNRKRHNPAYIESTPACWKALSRAAAALNWPYVVHQMTANDVLIADDQTQQAIREHKPQNGPRFLSPEKAAQEVGQLDGRVFVLMTRGEKELVRRLRNENPDGNIVSVTYGSAVSVHSAKAAVEGLRFSFLFTSPGSGTDYVADLMQANRMATTIDLFDSITAAWINVAEDFNPVRYAASKMPTLDASATRGKVCIRLPVDCLETLRKRRQFLPKSLKSYCLQLNARCIYMVRRSKADQAALLRLAQELPIEEDREPGKAGLKFTNSKMPNSADLLPIALDLMELEVRFEKFLGNLPQLRVLTYEEARTSPVDVLNMLAAFLGSGLLRKVNVLDAKPYDFAPKWRSRMRKQFKKDVEAFFGLEINEVGSYAPALLRAFNGAKD